MQQNKVFPAPCRLIDAVSAYAANEPIRFHMPGHKGFLDPLDVTELPGTDNLHRPTEAIKELESRCAKAFCARDSLLLVNGSTAGNIGMLMSIGNGKRVLLGRNCHKSGLSGIAIAGHDAVGLYPDEFGIVSPADVANALDEAAKNAPCDAVFITSPTYMGRVCDIDAIAKVVHDRGALLFVDCAHGAHFSFSKLLPAPPTAADAWVISCHKTLNALTQTAVLNLGESFPYSVAYVRRLLGIIQSTSPSYKLMLSIENAIEHADGWTEHVLRMREFRKRLTTLPEIELEHTDTAFDFDVTRLTLSVRGMIGYHLGALLESRGIFPEMCDVYSATFITAPCDPDFWYERLFDELRTICTAHTNDAPLLDSYVPYAMGGEKVMDVRSAMLSGTSIRPLDSSIGCVSAQAVGIYPPGIATLYPGERISREAVKLLTEQAALGAELFGTVLDGQVVIVDEGENAGCYNTSEDKL